MMKEECFYEQKSNSNKLSASTTCLKPFSGVHWKEMERRSVRKHNETLRISWENHSPHTRSPNIPAALVLLCYTLTRPHARGWRYARAFCLGGFWDFKSSCLQGCLRREMTEELWGEWLRLWGWSEGALASIKGPQIFWRHCCHVQYCCCVPETDPGVCSRN